MALVPDLLPATVARLKLGASDATGFFVTDDLVLTCAHLSAKPAEVGTRVEVEFAGSSSGGVVEQAFRDGDANGGYPDLMTVRLDRARSNPVWVYLTPGFATGDEVYSYGFPKKYGAGDSFNGVVEGPSGLHEGRELIKFKATKVSPGVSGSPLLNLRTGGVCGMIQIARLDTEGGRALPTSKILELLPELHDWQRAHASANATWLRSLSPGQLGADGWAADLVRIAKRQVDPFVPYCRLLVFRYERHLESNILPGAEPLAIAATDTPRALRTNLPDALAVWKPPIFSPKVRSTSFGAPEFARGFTTLDDALHEYRWRLLLLGEPGSGKTVSLLKIAQDAAQARLRDPSMPVPLYVPCRLWSGDPDESIATWIARICELPPADVVDAISQGQALIILDGLDELDRSAAGVAAAQAKAGDAISTFLRALADLGDTKLVLSCRRADYQVIADTVPHRTYLLGAATLDRLSPAQVSEYLSDVPDLRKALAERPDFDELTARPLLLNLLTATFLRDPTRLNSLPETTGGAAATELFGSFIETRFGWETERPSSPTSVTLDEFRRILGAALLRSVSFDDPSGEWMLDRGALEEASDGRAAELLELATNMELVAPTDLIPLSLVRFSFRHALLRDYLVYPVAIEALGDPDPKVAHAAVVALGRIGDAAAAEPLMALIRHPDTPKATQLQALAALGSLRDPITYQLLRDAASESSENAFSVAEAWRAHGGAQAVQELTAMTEGQIGQLPAMVALTRLVGHTPAARDQFIEFLRERHYLALLFAREIDLSVERDRGEMLQIFRSCLESDIDPLLHGGVIAALIKHGDLSVIKMIIHRVAAADREIGGFARKQLGRLTSEAIPELRIVAETGPPADRAIAVDAIAAIGGSVAIQNLAEILSDRPDEHDVMLRALTHGGEAAIDETIRRLEQATAGQEQVDLATTLGTGSVAGFERLLRSTNTLDPVVARVALIGVFAMRDFDPIRLRLLLDAFATAGRADAELIAGVMGTFSDVRYWKALRDEPRSGNANDAMLDAAIHRIDARIQSALERRLPGTTIEPDDLVRACELLDILTNFPLERMVEHLVSSTRVKDLQLLGTALAAIVYSDRADLSDVVGRLTADDLPRDRDHPSRANQIALRTVVCLALLGGRLIARKLARELQRLDHDAQVKIAERVLSFANPQFIDGIITLQHFMSESSDADRRKVLARPGRHRKGRGPGRALRPEGLSGIGLERLTVELSTRASQDAVDKYMVKTLHAKDSDRAREFALTWLVAKRPQIVRPELHAMVRPGDAQEHLAVLALGLLGEQSDRKRILGYARKADAFGRACAAAALLRLSKIRTADLMLDASSHTGVALPE